MLHPAHHEYFSLITVPVPGEEDTP